MFHASYKRYYEPGLLNFMFSSTLFNGFATAVTYPMEMLKTKMQVRAEGIGIRQKSMWAGHNPFHIERELGRAGYGVKSLWTGFEAGLAARMTAVTVRNLVYKVLYDRIKPRKPTNDLTYIEKGFLSGVAGACGAVASNPLEIIMVRNVSDLGRSAEFRRDYPSLKSAYEAVGKEGSHGLWRGLSAHLARAVALNTVMIWPYDSMQEHFYNVWGESWLPRPLALVIAAFWGAALTLPFDNLKTRMQNQFVDPNQNRMNYTGFVNAAKQVFYTEGSLSFWVGFGTYYSKVLTYAFITLFGMDWYLDKCKINAGLAPEYM